jgi:hypothetical protein
VTSLAKQTGAASNLPTRSLRSSAKEKFLAWMGPPPILSDEDASHYQHVLTLVAEAMRPVDILDWFWVRDVTDLEWEIIRFRKIKTFMLGEREFQMIEPTTTQAWLCSTFMSRHKTLERVDRMIMTLELRRDRVYRECERRAAGSVAQLRRAAEQIEDAEFREIEQSDDATQKRAA